MVLHKGRFVYFFTREDGFYDKFFTCQGVQNDNEVGLRYWQRNPLIETSLWNLNWTGYKLGAGSCYVEIDKKIYFKVFVFIKTTENFYSRKRKLVPNMNWFAGGVAAMQQVGQEYKIFVLASNIVISPTFSSNLQHPKNKNKKAKCLKRSASLISIVYNNKLLYILNKYER